MRRRQALKNSWRREGGGRIPSVRISPRSQLFFPFRHSREPSNPSEFTVFLQSFDTRNVATFPHQAKDRIPASDIPETRYRSKLLYNADTQRAMRVLETSHPPTYYIPRADIHAEFLSRASRHTFCEFKGLASYWALRVGDRFSANAAWSYENPAPGYESIRGHLAFYVTRVDKCFVNGEQVEAQPGEFYGGWLTSEIIGPFKGGPGSASW
jgi:uncharacterized protein (DUF427 family)